MGVQSDFATSITSVTETVKRQDGPACLRALGSMISNMGESLTHTPSVTAASPMAKGVNAQLDELQAECERCGTEPADSDTVAAVAPTAFDWTTLIPIILQLIDLWRKRQAPAVV